MERRFKPFKLGALALAVTAFVGAQSVFADLTVSPTRVTVPRGGDSPVITVTRTACPAAEPLIISPDDWLAPQLTALSQPTFPGVDPATVNFKFSLSTAIPPGSYTIRLEESQCAFITSLTVRVPRPTTGISPRNLAVRAGDTTATTSFQLVDFAGATAQFAIRDSDSLGGRLTLVPNPVSVTIPSTSSRGAASMQIQAAPDTPPGTYRVFFDETSAFGLPSTFVDLTVRAAAAPPPPPPPPPPPSVEIAPIIEQVVPGSVPAGTSHFLIRVIGRNFQPGAELIGATPQVAAAGGSSLFGSGALAALASGSAQAAPADAPFRIDSTRVLSSTLIEAQLSLRRDAPPGPIQLDVVNPDGGRSSPSGVLVVRREGSLAGPVGVSAAAVVFPAPGSLMGQDERVYPRGLLVTSGSGVIVGTWMLDGQIFDRFIAHAFGGMPVSVQARIPIPQSSLGEHRIQLAIEQPQNLESDPVPFIQVRQRASRLRLLAPGDGRVITTKHRARFRWSITPGAEGYQVEILRDLPLLPIKIHTRHPEWIPTAQELSRIGAGVWRWRVRPIFPGGVESEPTDARALVVLPDKVALHVQAPTTDPKTGRALVRWSGGARGALYRVDLLAEDGETVLFRALSPDPRYLLPGADALGAAPAKVRVTAMGPGGEILGVSETVAAGGSARRWTARGYALAADTTQPQLTGVTPGDGATVDNSMPHIEAAWEPAIDAAEVSLVIDDTDVTGVAQVSGSSISYDSLLELAAGAHTVYLKLGESAYSWSFQVSAPGGATSAQSAAAGGQDLGSQKDRRWGNWQMGVNGSIDGSSGDMQQDTAAGRVTLSAQTDTQDAKIWTKINGDAAGTQEFAPDNRFHEDNRSWVLNLGTKQGRFAEEATLGYAAPDFLSDTQLVATGLTKGGAVVKLHGPGAVVSGYTTFDGDQAGIVTGGFSSKQNLRAGGLTFGGQGPFSLRLVGLDVEDKGDGFNPGGNGKVYGLIGSWQIGAGVSMQFEGARSDVTPDPSSFSAPSKGNALRLGLTGSHGTVSWSANLRYTEANFLNPANNGMTPGSVNDRTGADLTFNKGFQRSQMSLGYSYSANETGASQSVNRFNLSYLFQFTDRIAYNFSGAYGLTKGSADPTTFFPGVDATDWNISTGFAETLGGLSLAQTLALSESNDSLDPTRFNRTTGINLSASASPSSRLSLAGNGTWMRTELDPAFGNTDSLTLTFNPALLFRQGSIQLRPYLNYSESRQDLTPGKSRMEAYQLTLGWTPQRLGSMLTFELGSSWNRSRGAGVPGAGFIQRYTANISFNRNWQPGSGAPMYSQLAPPTPGMTPARANMFRRGVAGQTAWLH